MRLTAEDSYIMDLYKQKGLEVYETLQGYYKETEGWSTSKKTDKFTIQYRPSKEFSGYLYRGEAFYNCPPQTVFDFVDPLPDSPRNKWDKNMKKIEVLKWIEKPHLRINRACTASAMLGIVSPRDFVDLIYTNETDETISTNAISIEFSDCPEEKDHVRGWNWSCGMICVKFADMDIPEFPEEKKYVRGWNYPCGLIIVKLPDNPNKCKLVSLIQPDIKGSLPPKIADAAIPGSMTEFFNHLEEALINDGKIIAN